MMKICPFARHRCVDGGCEVMRPILEEFILRATLLALFKKKKKRRRVTLHIHTICIYQSVVEVKWRILVWWVTVILKM